MSQADNADPKANGSSQEPDKIPDSSKTLSTALETLKPQIAAEIATILKERGGQDGQKVERAADRVQRIVVRAVKEELFQGPLPPPSHLREYEEICPGAATRIIAMAETHQKHRQGWERRSLNFEFIYSFGGLAFGFLVAIGLIAGAIITGLNGYPAVAGGFLAASAVGMVPAIIKGREIFQRKDTKPAASSGSKNAKKKR